METVLGDPALLPSSLFFHTSVITVIQGQVISTCIRTGKKEEVILLIYHAIDMKITISGNKIVITMLMQLHTSGCLKSRRWERREAGGGSCCCCWFFPTVTESGGTSVNITAAQYFICVSRGRRVALPLPPSIAPLGTIASLTSLQIPVLYLSQTCHSQVKRRGFIRSRGEGLTFTPKSNLYKMLGFWFNSWSGPDQSLCLLAVSVGFTVVLLVKKKESARSVKVLEVCRFNPGYA